MISITKFERDFLQNPNDKNNTFKNMPLLTYRFIDTFPVDINAVPMSYDGSTFLQVTVVFSYLRHTIEKHGNAQQSVRERLANTNQLTQVNPLRPRAVGREIAPSSNDPNLTKPVGYVTGEPYYGPYHEHKLLQVREHLKQLKQPSPVEVEQLQPKLQQQLQLLTPLEKLPLAQRVLLVLNLMVQVPMVLTIIIIIIILTKTLLYTILNKILCLYHK
jgi:hypothetical protein